MTTTSVSILAIADIRDFRERVRVLLLAHSRARVVADLAADPPAVSDETTARIAAVRRVDADDHLLHCIAILILCKPDLVAGKDPSKAGGDITDEVITAEIETYLLVWAAT